MFFLQNLNIIIISAFIQYKLLPFMLSVLTRIMSHRFHPLSGSQSTCWSLWRPRRRSLDTVRPEPEQTAHLQRTNPPQNSASGFIFRTDDWNRTKRQKRVSIPWQTRDDNRYCLAQNQVGKKKSPYTRCWFCLFDLTTIIWHSLAHVHIDNCWSFAGTWTKIE